MIKAIFFDIGGVIKKHPAEVRQAEVARRLGINEGKFIDFWKEHRNQMATGEMKEEDFCRLAEEKFKVSGALKIQREEHEKSSRTSINAELLELIEKLKNKYIIGLISNVSNIQKEYNEKAGLYKPFDPCILSCDVGFVKPDEEIYELALEKTGLKPEDCVVIDDRKGCLTVADLLGFKTILFENNEKLKEELEKAEVKS